MCLGHGELPQIRRSIKVIMVDPEPLRMPATIAALNYVSSLHGLPPLTQRTTLGRE